MIRALAYWHSGGDVVSAGGQALDEGDVEALLAWHEDELRAARAVKDTTAQASAAWRAGDLVTASIALERWRRAARPVAKISG